MKIKNILSVLILITATLFNNNLNAACNSKSGGKPVELTAEFAPSMPEDGSYIELVVGDSITLTVINVNNDVAGLKYKWSGAVGEAKEDELNKSSFTFEAKNEGLFSVYCDVTGALAPDEEGVESTGCRLSNTWTIQVKPFKRAGDYLYSAANIPIDVGSSASEVFEVMYQAHEDDFGDGTWETKFTIASSGTYEATSEDNSTPWPSDDGGGILVVHYAIYEQSDIPEVKDDAKDYIVAELNSCSATPDEAKSPADGENGWTIPFKFLQTNLNLVYNVSDFEQGVTTSANFSLASNTVKISTSTPGKDGKNLDIPSPEGEDILLTRTITYEFLITEKAPFGDSHHKWSVKKEDSTSEVKMNQMDFSTAHFVSEFAEKEQ